MLQRRMLKGKDTANTQADWHTIYKKLDVILQSMENEAAPHVEEDCLILCSGAEGVMGMVETKAHVKERAP